MTYIGNITLVYYELMIHNNIKKRKEEKETFGGMVTPFKMVLVFDSKVKPEATGGAILRAIF